MLKTPQKFFLILMLCLGLSTQNLAAGVSFVPPGQPMTPGGGWVIFNDDNHAHMLRIFPSGHFQYREGDNAALGNWHKDPEGFLARLRTFSQGMIDNAISLLQPLFFNIENSVRLLTPQTVFQALEAFYTSILGPVPAPIPFHPLITIGLNQVIINLQNGPTPMTLTLNTGPGAPAQAYILLLIQFGLFSNDQLAYLASTPTTNTLLQIIHHMVNPTHVQIPTIDELMAAAHVDNDEAVSTGSVAIPHTLTPLAYQIAYSPDLWRVIFVFWACLNHLYSPAGRR